MDECTLENDPLRNEHPSTGWPGRIERDNRRNSASADAILQSRDSAARAAFAGLERRDRRAWHQGRLARPCDTGIWRTCLHGLRQGQYDR